MAGRNTRSSKPSKAPAPPSPTVSDPPAPSSSNRPWARPTTNADKEALQDEYSALFELVDQLKQDVVDADEKSQKQAGQAFYNGLVSCAPTLSFFCLIDIDFVV
jgi:hypothetical protein